VDRKLGIDEWISLEMSSRKSVRKRKITELLERLQPGDIVIVSELSRLGRSIKEVLATVETLIEDKRSRLILVKQNLDVDPDNTKDLTNKILITIFSMMAGPPWPNLNVTLFPNGPKKAWRLEKLKGLSSANPKALFSTLCTIKIELRYFTYIKWVSL
jgi:hypothetical protein